jgi:hypothetical protein
MTSKPLPKERHGRKITREELLELKHTPYDLPWWFTDPASWWANKRNQGSEAYRIARLAKAGQLSSFYAECRKLYNHPVGSDERDEICLGMFMGHYWIERAEKRRARSRRNWRWTDNAITKSDPEAPARVAADQAKGGHGTYSKYSNDGCRCEPCSAANRQRMREYRERRRAAA